MPFCVQTGRMANMDVTPLALTSASAATQLPFGRQLHQVLVLLDLCMFDGSAVTTACISMHLVIVQHAVVSLMQVWQLLT